MSGKGLISRRSNNRVGRFAEHLWVCFYNRSGLKATKSIALNILNHDMNSDLTRPKCQPQVWHPDGRSQLSGRIYRHLV